MHSQSRRMIMRHGNGKTKRRGMIFSGEPPGTRTHPLPSDTKLSQSKLVANGLSW